MKIVFLLPSTGASPIGGFKMAYVMADGLAGRGHDVTVLHPSLLSMDPLPIGKRIRRSVFGYAKHALRGTWKPASWFTFRNPVNLEWIPALHRAFLPRADAYIATWWLTAERLASWKNLSGIRLYYLQHFETWGGPEDRVLATYHSDLRKIAISRWIQGLVRDLGEDATYIPHGLDFDAFGCDCNISERGPDRVGMLFHGADWKGSIDGINALKLAKEIIPTLSAELFGVPDPPPDLPEWIQYLQNPPQSELRRYYNRTSIFVSPSWMEGWGLPPAEAMMCGAAVAATDIGGHREFCIDGVTALLAPAKNPVELANRILRLVQDSALREKIAKQGQEFVRRFTWEKALDAFENALRRQ